MAIHASTSQARAVAPLKINNVPRGTRPIQVLLAEDNDDDAELIRFRFEQARLAIDLHRVENGEECLAFLHKQGKYTNAPDADLLFLDLHMPIMTGKDVLAEIAADETLRALPIVVLTTALEAEYIRSQYDFRSNAYVKKPVAFEEFARIVRAATNFWFTVVAVQH